MSFVDRAGIIMIFDKVKVGRGSMVKPINGMAIQITLVFLQCQYIIPALLIDLAGDVGLATHRINGDDAALHCQ